MTLFPHKPKSLSCLCLRSLYFPWLVFYKGSPIEEVRQPVPCHFWVHVFQIPTLRKSISHSRCKLVPQCFPCNQKSLRWLLYIRILIYWVISKIEDDGIVGRKHDGIGISIKTTVTMKNMSIGCYSGQRIFSSLTSKI